MKRNLVSFYFCLTYFFAINAFAFQHEIAIGYGDGQEVEENYRNHGIVLNAKLYKFPKIDDTLYATIDATIASIHADTKHHRQLTTAALSLAMRAYFANPECFRIRPYLQASFGPSYLSSKTLGERSQGAHFAFQTTLEFGTEIGNDKHSIDLNIRMIHYCNAGIFHPNEGINLTPVFSIGYQF